MRSVTGYKGSQEVHLAVLRGEADMMDTGAINVLGPMIAGGKYAGVSQIGLFSDGKFVRRRAFEDVPLISEQLAPKGHMAEALSALKSWLNAAAIGKFYALPPNTPAAYAAAYRNAFTRMQADPEFQEKAKVALDPDYEMMSATDTKALVAAVMATSDADREFLASIAPQARLVARGRIVRSALTRPKRVSDNLAARANFMSGAGAFPT